MVMSGRSGFSRLRRRAGLGIAITAMALSLVGPTVIAPAAVLADGGQSDPAWDYGRGGVESPGNPARYLPAPSETMRKEYNVYRPACFAGKLQ